MKKILFKLIILILATSLIPVLYANTTRDLGKEPDLNPDNIVKWIIFYTNIERIENNLKPLSYDPNLEKAAYWQAEYCAKIKTLDHSANVAGMRTAKDRMEHFNRKCGFCGENLTVKFSTNSEGFPYSIKRDSKGTYQDFGKHTIYWRNERQMAYAMLDSWMKSKHHRDNILNPGFLWMGAGTFKGIYNNNKSYFGCQVFNGYGGLPPGFIKIEYELTGLKAEKGKINGKDAYLFSYKDGIEPLVIEVFKDSELIQHEITKKDDSFIFIKNAITKGRLFACLYDNKDKILYPVMLLK